MSENSNFLLITFVLADIVFVVREKSHPVFKRQGNDLVYAIDIPLVKALTNSIAVVKTLDERVLRIPINDVVR